MRLKSIVLFLTLILIAGVSLAGSSADVELLLFGGENHKVFLGCLNCRRYDQSSVWNSYGTYGSKYQSESIWNRYGTFGNKYNSESPCNKYSTEAPVIVDRDGGFYGHFSANKYHPRRTTISDMVWILDNYECVIDNLDEVRYQF